MTSPIVTVYYVLSFVAILWLALAAVSARLKGNHGSRNVILVLGVVATFAAFLPLHGLPLWRWAFSVWPNPSAPLVGMVGLALWRQWSGCELFAPTDRRAVWIFGAVAGTALYLHSFSPIAVDFYFWGWDGAVASSCLAALAIVFLAQGNRLGVLLLVALLAWTAHALESTNGWDYVVDPFYWLISLGLGVKRAFGCLLRRRSSPPRAA